MAGTKGSKYFDIFLNYQVWLERKNQPGRVADSLILLLNEIQSKGSLKSAAMEIGISYRKAWGDLKEAEEYLGFELIEATRGGKEGGVSRLTKNGVELVKAFEELHQEFDQAIYRIIRSFFAKLNQSDQLNE